MKKVYEKPQVREISSVLELTLGTQDGNSLDATFSAGTLRGSLTFS